MSAREYGRRVRDAWRALGEATDAQRRIDDAANEQRVNDASADVTRAVLGQSPIPPEVREAQHRLDEYFEDHAEEILAERDEDAPAVREYLDRMGQVTDLECAAGVHESCRHAGPGARSRVERERREEFDRDQQIGAHESGDVATVWGVIQPDGSVVPKGFVGDPDAEEDMRVHPPGAIAVHGVDGWVCTATGREPAYDPPRPRAPRDTPLPEEPPVGTVLETRDNAGRGEIERTAEGWRIRHEGDSEDDPGFFGRPIRWESAWNAWGPPSGGSPFVEVELDEPSLSEDAAEGHLDMPPAAEPYVPPQRKPTTPTPARPAVAHTSTGAAGSGGAGMSNVEDARSTIMAAHHSADQALTELESAYRSLEDAQNGLRQGTEGSHQAEAEQAHNQMAEAINKIDEARQQVRSALEEFDGVANRL